MSKRQTYSQSIQHCSIVMLLSAVLIGCGSNEASSPDFTSGDSSIALPTANSTVSAPSNSGSGNSSNPPTSNLSANITFTWSAPANREDGSTLLPSEILGYEISYLNSVNELTIVNLENPQNTSHTINNLPIDDYRFTVFAYDTNNAVSNSSPIAFISREDFASF